MTQTTRATQTTQATGHRCLCCGRFFTSELEVIDFCAPACRTRAAAIETQQAALYEQAKRFQVARS